MFLSRYQDQYIKFFPSGGYIILFLQQAWSCHRRTESKWRRHGKNDGIPRNPWCDHILMWLAIDWL